MPNQSIPATPIGAEPWAVVRARGRVIRYRRAGAGRAVVVVLSPGPVDSLWPGLVANLGDHFRLVVPEPPTDGADVAAWLGDFLEGLGAPTVGILAAGCFCVPALELALLESQHLSCLVLVPDGQQRNDGVLEGGLETAISGSIVPLLVTRCGHPAGDAGPLVKAFLKGETAAPA